MKIIISIGHPADVHFFYPFIKKMTSIGHKITVIAREKEVTFYLLEKFNVHYIGISNHKKKIIGKLFNYVIRWIKVFAICRKYKPDVSIGLCDFILPQVSRVIGFSSFVVTDMEYVIHDAILTFPFASFVLTPKSFKKSLGKKQIRFNSFKELAYINQSFKPDKSILSDLCVKKNERYILLRFVSHSAVHDIGYHGLSNTNKIEIVNKLLKHAKVFISSEEKLPQEIEQYKLNIAPEKIHEVIKYSSLLYGESSTMAAEAACMGVPSIFIDNMGRGYTDEIEQKYQLIFNFNLKKQTIEATIKKALSIIHSKDERYIWNNRKNKMLNDKESMTGFLIKEICNCLPDKIGDQAKWI